MEILAPAGNLEKLHYALAYNADAVYLAGQNYGLRAFAGNFSLDEMKEGIRYTHKLNKKAYLTLNVFSRNEDIASLPEYLQEISSIGLDAIIVSEPGSLLAVKKYTDYPIHLSTQANTTNWQAVKFWQEQGIKRVILAREVTYAEMLEIRDKVPEMQLEVFIHGAMCMAWSGRCLMSALLNDRSANQGECTHPCRWEWNLTEPTRPGQVFSIEEDKRGSYLMHSKDLCLLKEMPLLSASGLSAGKIEGRMKSTYYTALMSRIYHEASNLQVNSETDWQQLSEETGKVNHRPYFTGFFYSGNSSEIKKQLADIDVNQNTQDWQYCGKATSAGNGLLWFDCLSKVQKGDHVQVIFPQRKDDVNILVDKIYDEENNLVSMTKPNRSFAFPIDTDRYEWGLIRKLETGAN